MLSKVKSPRSLNEWPRARWSIGASRIWFRLTKTMQAVAPAAARRRSWLAISESACMIAWAQPSAASEFTV